MRNRLVARSTDTTTHERGATAVEFGLMVALVIIIVIVAITLLVTR
ncbi:hypothetical protein ABEG17_19640 [Pedococcus sp. KACC 23699]|uniref:Flp family type IVb pilin n=1 Tax=Pedococcus sp. KACC 23699 TaxID=3149228 RepID=A0AAU7JTJ7_9MICO